MTEMQATANTRDMDSWKLLRYGITAELTARNSRQCERCNKRRSLTNFRPKDLNRGASMICNACVEDAADEGTANRAQVAAFVAARDEAEREAGETL